MIMHTRNVTWGRHVPVFLVGLSIVLARGNGHAAGQERAERPAEIWIYKDMPKEEEKDTRTDTEAMFAPYGFMPKERANQIAVNIRRLVNRADPGQGTCIEYSFKFVDKQNDWQGVYTLVGGDA